MAIELKEEWYERLGITHSHTPAGTIGIGVISVILGWYAGWITADLGFRIPTFIGVAIVAVVWLYRQHNGWAALSQGLYLLSALLVLTPIIFNLAFVLDAGRYGISDVAGFVLTISDLVFVLVFAVLAAIPAGIATLIRRKKC